MRLTPTDLSLAKSSQWVTMDTSPASAGESGTGCQPEVGEPVSARYGVTSGPAQGPERSPTEVNSTGTSRTGTVSFGGSWATIGPRIDRSRGATTRSAFLIGIDGIVLELIVKADVMHPLEDGVLIP